MFAQQMAALFLRSEKQQLQGVDNVHKYKGYMCSLKLEVNIWYVFYIHNPIR